MTAPFTRKPFRLLIDQAVPMRDGVRLSADVYLPSTGGPFPALLLRTIYDNQEPRYIRWTRRFVEAGLCGGSTGLPGPTRFRRPVGPLHVRARRWVRHARMDRPHQEWCDGQIGTFGLSYPGFTQTLPATLRSRYLKALVPIASQQDNYGHHRVDGVIHHAVSLFFSQT